MASPQSFLVNIDLNQNQLLNPIYQLVSIFPKNPKIGQFCYLISDYLTYQGNTPYYYNGTNWIQYGTSEAISNITTNNSYITITNSSSSTNISINQQNQNLFLASPISGIGDTLFRAIDISDLPNLSSLYVENQNISLQTANFWINYGKFSDSIELSSNIPSSTTNRLYNNSGTLYWNGNPIGSNTFLNIANGIGTTEFSSSSSTDTLRFDAGTGLLVTFDPSTKKVTYSVGSDITVTTTNYYYYEFTLPETIFNTNQYFYSWSKSSTANNLLRSNSSAGIENDNTVVPIISPMTGIIVRAILQLKGAGVQNGSVTYPVYYKCQIYKVGYTSLGSQYNCYFPISSSYAIATYAPGETNAFIELTGLNISVNKGDMLSLMFDPTTSDFGAASTVGHMKNAYVTLVLSDSGTSGGGSGGGGGSIDTVEFDFTVVSGTIYYGFTHNLNKIDPIVVLVDPTSGESLTCTWFANAIGSIGVLDYNHLTIEISPSVSVEYSTRTLRIAIT